jgi:hypothetical protein
VTTLGAAAAPHLVRAALPVGKKLLTVSADLVLAGFGAFSEASKKSRERRRDRQAAGSESTEGSESDTSSNSVVKQTPSDKGN